MHVIIWQNANLQLNKSVRHFHQALFGDSCEADQRVCEISTVVELHLTLQLDHFPSVHRRQVRTRRAQVNGLIGYI